MVVSGRAFRRAVAEALGVRLQALRIAGFSHTGGGSRSDGSYAEP
jgi:hypothetical protein